MTFMMLQFERHVHGPNFQSCERKTPISSENITVLLPIPASRGDFFAP
jgi:hypothetical protein